MNSPKRIQRKRTKGWRMPPNTVYVGRPTKWGNPFPVGGPFANLTQQQAVNAFIDYAEKWFDSDDLNELRGKDLCCWCNESEPCHADILLELANKTTNE